MSLEQKVRTTRVLRRVPSREVKTSVAEGKKFIVVDEEFDHAFIPRGYSLIDMRFKDEVFSTLVPQSLLFYMVNPGEGDAGDALDDLADFYDDAKGFEDNMIEDGETSVQGTNWATIARGAYDTYLINRLVKSSWRRDDEGEPIPKFDEKVLKSLDLRDSYVQERVRAMAGVALGKSASELKEYGIDSVLKHVTIQEERVEELTREEFKKITCWSGSHWALKPEFRNNPDGTEYNIEHRHDKSYMKGTKKVKHRDVAVMDSNIRKLEEEIEEHRHRKHGQIGRHDRNLLRQYANLAYIAPENPKAQLDVKPPERKE